MDDKGNGAVGRRWPPYVRTWRKDHAREPATILQWYAGRWNLKLSAQASFDDRHRAAVAIESRVDDELVVCRQPPTTDWQAVVGFQNLLRARMWQLAVTDQD